MCAHVISLRRFNRRVSRPALLGLCLFGLASCAAVRPSPALPDLSTWELRQTVLGNISNWEFKGRIAVKAGDEGFNGKFNWTQAGDAFDATVSGPLGIGTVRIKGDDQAIVLTDKDGIQTVLVEPEKELYTRYGWTIPIASLRFWALGIPDPAAPAATELDEAGRLARLVQSNWVVEISRYRNAAGQQLPHKLTVSNPNTRVRMVIDKWTFFDR
ncbi:MAG: outer membrane lipoprotein LolB [Proteobacteria bacterium]|nr:outer membrane lipoprotein LolB [Pseudomonadota bacterium]